jgi:hypothetical protein
MGADLVVGAERVREVGLDAHEDLIRVDGGPE